jgi:hypothetical protein
MYIVLKLQVQSHFIEPSPFPPFLVNFVLPSGANLSTKKGKRFEAIPLFWRGRSFKDSVGSLQAGSRVARFFSVKLTKTEENIPANQKIYQMPLILTNARKIGRMAI